MGSTPNGNIGPMISIGLVRPKHIKIVATAVAA
jgi:hypothetical protein